MRYASIYNEAIAEKIREGAPLASYAIDRRALQNFNDALHENSICAPMCFLCGCIYIYRERPTEDLRPGQVRGENYIQWQKPFEKDDMFFSLARLQTEEQYGQQTYLRKYNSDVGRFLNLRYSVKEFEDWTLDAPFRGGSIRICVAPKTGAANQSA